MTDFKQKVILLLVCFSFLTLVAGAQAVVVEDELGHLVTVPKLPRRILPLAPSVAEILFALGLDERIVGVTAAISLLTYNLLAPWTVPGLRP